MTFILGLTGGIGSGKSAASQWFESQGIVVVDADIVAREIVEKGQPALKKIQEVFGDWTLTANGELDRRALREHILKMLRHANSSSRLPTLRFELQSFNNYKQLPAPMQFWFLHCCLKPISTN